MKIRLNRGLTIDSPGAPEQSIHDVPAVRTFAVVIGDELEAAPELCVEQGDAVRAGEAVCRASHNPAVRFTTPVSGRVVAVNRGERRRLLSVIIADDGTGRAAEFRPVPADASASLDAEEVRSRLLESGLWTAFRARPFDRIPDPSDTPAAILVTAIDTNPLACDPAVVIGTRNRLFIAGISVLGALAERLCLCKSPSLQVAVDEMPGVEVFDFIGPHPAGLPGTHVAHVMHATETRPVWYVGYQDVIAIGELFSLGRCSGERVVAVGGPGAVRPRLLRTKSGAALDELLNGEIAPNSRVILGSMLAGREPKPATAYLGRYETQLTVLEPLAEHSESAGHGLVEVLEKLLGGARVMLPLEKFERLWPMPQPVLPLLRALLIGDVGRAVELGCLDLAEEDLALCSYACPGKLDYGAALRATLSQLQRRD